VTRTVVLPFAAIKELRALWLAWLATVVWIVASDVLAFPPMIGISTYFLGAVVLGALSVGHEYSHHTLALLLSQPARRERVLLVKLGVLAAMLLALAAVAHPVAFRHIRAPESEKLAAFVLPVVGGLFVAPWLTMVCRNPLGGAVFTLVIPGVLHVIGDLLGLRMYARSAEADRLRMATLSWGAISFCVLGAVMTWRMFRRLEAIDGRGPDVRLPQWLRWQTTRTETTAFRKRHPLWLLAKKELRLQQLAFVVAGLYVLGSLGGVSLSRLTPQQSAVFDVLTTCYALLIAVLIGSLASAEERQLGTLAWQLLLPIATAKQWAVKVAIAFGLALPLALGMPALVAFLHPTADMIRFSEHVFQPPVMVAVILLIAMSLYVSSLCTSGLWTLLISVPAIFGATQFVKFLGDELGPRVFGLVFRRIAIGGADQIPFKSLIALLLTGFLVLILRFGLINHRSTERVASRVWTQAIWMTGYVVLGIVLITRLAGLTAR
jgi:hypothetical protein